MRWFLRTLVAASLAVGPAVASASAASIESLLKMKAAGLSDDVIIGVIDSDGSVFHLDEDNIIALKKGGLSDRVILAMLATAKPRPAPEPPAAPARDARPERIAPPAPVTVQDAQPPAVAPGPPVVINITQTVEAPPAAPASYLAPVYYGASIVTRRPIVSHQQQTSHQQMVVQQVPGGVLLDPRARPLQVQQPQQAPQPVYWGFGGQRRPDTWRDK